MAYLLKKCKLSGVEWKMFNSLDKCKCKLCKAKKPQRATKKPKPIRKVSTKQEKLNKEYSILRVEFLSLPENQICPVTKQQATEVHHKYSGKDRAKYFLETTTWLGVSRLGHIWIHENSKLARELEYLY